MEFLYEMEIYSLCWKRELPDYRYEIHSMLSFAAKVVAAKPQNEIFANPC